MPAHLTGCFPFLPPQSIHSNGQLNIQTSGSLPSFAPTVSFIEDFTCPLTPRESLLGFLWSLLKANFLLASLLIVSFSSLFLGRPSFFSVAAFCLYDRISHSSSWRRTYYVAEANSDILPLPLRYWDFRRLLRRLHPCHVNHPVLSSPVWSPTESHGHHLLTGSTP